AKKDGLQYFWVNSCYINKLDTIKLQTTINLIFHWYSNIAKYYIYLLDVLAGKHSRLFNPL
ncbi:uncharacterized protein K441DRAFT_564810, partial [Cenococcum geophilum 1.58]|uniref:uncharacterized protein n=1 Tax=Cenococcum geophilum 1.58 TaxID=794803 RepID=UPI00358E55C6